MNAQQRTALYIAAGAIIAAIAGWGVITQEQGEAILAVVAGILGVVMAFTAVTHIKPDEPKVEPTPEPPVVPGLEPPGANTTTEP